MKKNVKKKFKSNKYPDYLIYNLVFRYTAILLLSLGNLFIFYKIFTPLTIYPTFLILKLIYAEVYYSGIIIYLNQYSIFLIKSCIAGSAYFLLFALVFSTPMKLLKRIYLLISVFSLFLIINLIRIIFLVYLLVNNSNYFDISHKFLWYGLSTIFIVVIWFFSVWLFKIKDIPVYTDMKHLVRIIKKGK